MGISRHPRRDSDRLGSGSTGRLVRASLDGNVEKVCSLVDALSREDPRYTLHVGVHAAEVALLDGSPPEGVYHKVRRLLERPSEDTELRLLLLMNAARLAVRVRRHDEARRLFRLARQIGADDASADMQAGLLLAEAMLRESAADHAGAAQLCTSALRRRPVEHTPFWARLTSQRALFAALAHDFGTAETDLEMLDAQPALADALVAPVPALRARLCCERGEAVAGLRQLDEVDGDRVARSLFVRLSVELLIRADRADEATIVLDQAATEPRTLNTPVARGLHAMLALYAGDIAAARRHGRAAIEGVDRGLPLDFELPLRMLAEFF